MSIHGYTRMVFVHRGALVGAALTPRSLDWHPMPAVCLICHTFNAAAMALELTAADALPLRPLRQVR